VNNNRRLYKANHHSLGDSTFNKLASSRKNTRKNPDTKQTSPVSNPEKILKSRKYLKQNLLSTFNTNQSNFTKSNSSESFERSLSLPPSFESFYFPEVSSPIFQESSPNTVPNSSPNLTMAGENVGGGGGGGRGGGNQIPVPVIFSKVAARYAPLVLPAALHDLLENYMKSLPKFTGEGDLTAQEHINFFDQFADILGIEHENFYSRLRVQTFEG
jgi:hypothetical protein